MRHSGWIDLASASPSQEIDADVCIVGAGAAGIYLAVDLARKGTDVVLIEAGPVSAIDAGEMGFGSLFEVDDYPGATIGRFFGMGGSTTCWGGALVPHTSHDLRTEGRDAKEWKLIVDRVAARATDVLERLGYRNDANFSDYANAKLGAAAVALARAGIDVQANLLLPFRRKNFLGLLPEVSGLRAAPRVFFNAVAKTWQPKAGQGDEARIDKLIAVSRNRNELTVRAKKYIVAAGAIESARILLEINESAAQPVLRAGAATGCYLADHLSLPIADVVPGGLGRATNLFAPRFEGSWMRGIRLLEKTPPSDAPRSFAHFIFTTESAGFALAKQLFGAVQKRGLPDIRFNDVVAGIGDLAKLAYHRYARATLYVPSGSPIHLQLDIEQFPIRENRVNLVSLRDEYGRKKGSIHWQITERDLTSLAETAGRILSQWPGNVAGLPELIPRAINSDSRKPHDAYHPVGTCRMGSDSGAVVDSDLKVRGVENLWVVSTGVLPSAGTANPTFTMLCLAHHLANHLRLC